MNKAELNETINRYYMANEEKKAAEAEVKGMREEIMGYFEDKDIQNFTTKEGFTAAINFRKGSKINLDKGAKLLGGTIPAECFEPTITPVFTVKAPKAAKSESKMAVVKAGVPSSAVVAA